MMDLIIAALLVLAKVAWDELRDCLPSIAKRIVLNAAKNVVPDLRERMAEEWLAELAVVPGKIVPFLWACNLWWGMSRSRLARLAETSTWANQFLAAFFLLTLSPTLAVVAYLVFREDKGPTLVGYLRIGKNGKVFRRLKFRTTYLDANERLVKHLESDPVERARFHGGRPLKNDPRYTRFGRFMRKTALDELPVFLNILKGDMAFAGPRPITPQALARGTACPVERPGLFPSWHAFFKALPKILFGPD